MRYSAKPRVLILADYFLPGLRAGGPIRSLANLVEQLGDEFHFRIITRDRDFGERQQYSQTVANRWQPVGKAEVYYLSPPRFLPALLKSVLADWACEALYLNSFFSPFFTIQTLLLKKAGLIPDVPVMLAPRGELSSAALQTKPWKKWPYLNACRVLGLCSDVLWQASSPHEEKDIRRYFGPTAKIAVAPNLSVGAPQHLHGQRTTKEKGHLRVTFISRIARHKNLDFALRRLARLEGEVEFNIYGPLEEEGYWAECEALIRTMPKNVRVTYGGQLSHEEVFKTLSEHHLLFLPTRSENFGHVIAEALLAGCPVLISNQTPWKGLARAQAGWELPLEQPGLFDRALRSWLEMDSAAFAPWSMGARALGNTGLGANPLDEFRSLLRAALGPQPSPTSPAVPLDVRN